MKYILITQYYHHSVKSLITEYEKNENENKISVIIHIFIISSIIKFEGFIFRGGG